MRCDTYMQGIGGSATRVSRVVPHVICGLQHTGVTARGLPPLLLLRDGAQEVQALHTAGALQVNLPRAQEDWQAAADVPHLRAPRAQ